MTRDSGRDDFVELTKRQFIGATIGAGVLGTSSFVGGVAGSGSGGGGGGDGGGGPGGGTSPAREHTLTLVTGHTIVVTERERTVEGDDGSGETAVERTYRIAGDAREEYQVLQDEDGTYFLPDGVDLDRLDWAFFNLDYLIDYGYTDDQLDEIPVIARLSDGVTADAGGVSTLGADSTELSSIGAVATALPKSDVGTMGAGALTTGVDRLHLDRKREAFLDESAPAVDAPDARQEYRVDGEGIRIAVIDTGIDADHPDFGDRVVYEADFTGEGVDDPAGHGTHVAGIAAGDGTESGGDYVGVAPGADLLNVKALGRRGIGYTSDIVGAIEDAVANDADVINMSLGGPAEEEDPLTEAANWASDQGVVTVAAAGNKRDEADFRTVASPAAAAGAIAVGASDDDGDDGGRRPRPRRRPPSLASARGPAPHTFLVKPEVSAPGVDVTAAGSGDAGQFPYTEKTGTSMSAPHVAGMAALVLADDPDLDPDGVEAALVSTATFEDDRDVYKQGGGRIDGDAALDPDLLVRDAVLDFGLIQEAREETKSIAITNVADETTTVDVAATLENESEDEPLDGNVSVTPGSLDLDPGETASVEVTVDAADAFGMNAGVVTFAAGRQEYRTIFGFTRGIDLTIDKTLYEGRESADRDIGWIWTHDDSVSEIGFPFDADGDWNALLLQDEATVTVWSYGTLPPDRSREQGDTGDPVLTVASGVEVDPENNRIELDENDAVPRTVDTSPVDDRPTHEAFDASDFAPTLFGVAENLLANKVLSIGLVGNFEVYTAYFTPIDAGEPTNVATEWLFYPEHDSEYRYDVEDVYWLLEPAVSVPESGEVFEVSPETLAAEEITYHREHEGESLSVFPTAFTVDREQFPYPISFAALRQIGPDIEEQTWWRSPEVVEYAESWQDNTSTTNRTWVLQRGDRFVAPDAGTYSTEFNRAPLTQDVRNFYGTVVNEDVFFQWMSLSDQAPEQLAFLPLEDSGVVQIRHEGEVIAEDPDAGPAPPAPVETPAPTDLEAGDEVVFSYDAWELSRDPDLGFLVDYAVTYDPAGSSQPPEIADVHLPFLDSLNRMPAGDTVVWVRVDPGQELVGRDVDHPEEVVDFEAYYADGTATTAPFEDPDGWESAEVVYSDGGLFGLRVDATGDALDLAVAATNEADNTIRSTTLRAASVADPSVSVDVRADSITAGSNQTVPVVIEQTDGLNPHEDVDVESLRFGAPGVVEDGGGATVARHQELGNGDLQVHFDVEDLGYDESASPAPSVLAGERHDGTPVYGADVIDAVRLRGRAQDSGT